MRKFIIKTEDNIDEDFLMKMFDEHLPSEYIVEEIKSIDEYELRNLANNLYPVDDYSHYCDYEAIEFEEQIQEAFIDGYRKGRGE